MGAHTRTVLCMTGVIMVTDPLRIRTPDDSHHGSSDGIPDTLSGKVLGVGITLLGAVLRAAQCEWMSFRVDDRTD